jgi:hypothetical protein
MPAMAMKQDLMPMSMTKKQDLPAVQRNLMAVQKDLMALQR